MNNISRKNALRWWLKLSQSKKGLLMDSCFKNRHTESLTGREIETLWRSETEQIEEDVLKLNKDLDTDSGKTKMFAVVSKDENKPKELLLATTKKQAIILYNHWHYKFGKLNENLYVKEFKI